MLPLRRRMSPSIIFMIRLRRMVRGWMWKVTAAAGDLPWSFTTRHGARIAIAGTGSIRIMAGTGILIIPGEQRSIMAAGFITPALAGAGIRTPCGRRHGWPGVPVEIIAAGRRYRPLPSSALGSASFIAVRTSAWTSTLASPPTASSLSRRNTSATGARAHSACRTTAWT